MAALHTINLDGGTLSPMLLRAFAEAADGYRGKGPLWIVASESAIHEVRTFRGESAEFDAAQFLAGKDPEEEWFLLGPVDSSATWTDALPTIPGIGGGSGQLPNTPDREIIKMDLRFRMHDGTEEDMEVDLDEVDAVFASLSAIEKFVIPYYARLYGAGYAEALRAAHQAGTIRLDCHGPGSIPWTV